MASPNHHSFIFSSPNQWRIECQTPKDIAKSCLIDADEEEFPKNRKCRMTLQTTAVVVRLRSAHLFPSTFCPSFRRFTASLGSTGRESLGCSAFAPPLLCV
nr:hypothetical protein Iba_chr12dCG10540 [Ipomoea batatas]